MAAIGTAQAQLRQTHLKYHLSTAEVLTPEQVFSVTANFAATRPRCSIRRGATSDGAAAVVGQFH